MNLAQPLMQKPLVLHLRKDLVRNIKRGHPWVYDDALASRPDSPAGRWTLLKDRKGKEVAWGFYDPKGQLAFRACVLNKKELRGDWLTQRLEAAKKRRAHLIHNPQTNGFRLINGEGDGLPGLVIDIYGDTAVMQVDGDAPDGFWPKLPVAQWVAQQLQLPNVYFKRRRKEQAPGEVLVGLQPDHEPIIQENGAFYSVDVINGQKTGFFLDQRDNRLKVRGLSHGKTVLNVFGYTGGFSINAGLGGATQVTTVDLAPGAIEFAERNWTLNNLPEGTHEGVVADAFDFFDAAKEQNQRWDLTIVDPPSFAPSQETVARAVESYTRLFSDAIQVTQPGGLFCAASCSSHIPHALFMDICTQAFSNARSRGQVLEVRGQSEDHPYPLACPEMRYLKFAVFAVA